MTNASAYCVRGNCSEYCSTTSLPYKSKATIWTYTHDLWRLALMVAVLAIATVAFEQALIGLGWYLRENGHTSMQKAVQKATDELTILGFFSFCLLLTLQLQYSSPFVQANYLTFELAHVWIFALGLLHALVTILWSSGFAVAKRHFRSLGLLDERATAAMISQDYGELATDGLRDAAYAAKISGWRFALHRLDPLRLAPRPRFDRALEFLFLSRYFRWHHAHEIEHIFGPDGLEAPFEWEAEKKKDDAAVTTHASAAEEREAEAETRAHARVAELVTSYITFAVEEHLEVSPMMWLVFIILLLVALSFKILYNEMKVITDDNEYIVKHSLQRTAFALAFFAVGSLVALIVMLRTVRRCIAPRIAAKALGLELSWDASLHNAAFLAKGAIRCAEDRGHGTGHGGKGHGGKLAPPAEEEQSDSFVAQTVCAVFEDRDVPSTSPVRFPSASMPAALAAAGVTAMSKEHIAKLLLIGNVDGGDRRGVALDYAIDLVEAVLQEKRIQKAPPRTGKSTALGKLLLGGLRNGMLERAVETLSVEDGGGGGDVGAAAAGVIAQKRSGAGGVAVAMGSDDVLDSRSSGGGVNQIPWLDRVMTISAWLFDVAKVEMFFLWISRFLLLLLDGVLAYVLVIGLPETFTGKSYGVAEGLTYSIISVILLLITIFVLQPVMLIDIAYLNLFMGNDKHAMHHSLTKMRTRMNRGHTLHINLAQKIWPLVRQREKWRRVKMALKADGGIVGLLKRTSEGTVAGGRGRISISRQEKKKHFASDIEYVLKTALVGGRAERLMRRTALCACSAVRRCVRTREQRHQMSTGEKQARSKEVEELDSLSTAIVPRDLRSISDQLGLQINASDNKLLWKHMFPAAHNATRATVLDLAYAMKAVMHHVTDSEAEDVKKEIVLLRSLVANAVGNGNDNSSTTGAVQGSSSGSRGGGVAEEEDNDPDFGVVLYFNAARRLRVAGKNMKTRPGFGSLMNLLTPSASRQPTNPFEARASMANVVEARASESAAALVVAAAGAGGAMCSSVSGASTITMNPVAALLHQQHQEGSDFAPPPFEAGGESLPPHVSDGADIAPPSFDGEGELLPSFGGASDGDGGGDGNGDGDNFI